MTETNIVFKATKNGLVILLNKNLSFEELQQALSEKIESSKNFFGDTKTTVSFKGRDLTPEEEEKLVTTISSVSNLEITLLKNIKKEAKEIKEQAKEPKEKSHLKSLFSPNREKKVTNGQKVNSPFPTNLRELTAISSNLNETLFHTGSVRSGQILRHTGSIVIMGDVNPGAEVIAYGNIIILGVIKGLVHAGYPSSYDCYIAGLEINLAQIRIADLITYVSAENVHNTSMPTKIYTKDKQIYIEPIRDK